MLSQTLDRRRSRAKFSRRLGFKAGTAGAGPFFLEPKPEVEPPGHHTLAGVGVGANLPSRCWGWAGGRSKFPRLSIAAMRWKFQRFIFCQVHD